MTAWKSEQVLIVGGGIGGLTAALALARQGIASQIIEQAAEFKEIGAGIQLGPNVFRMFERLGLIIPVPQEIPSSLRADPSRRSARCAARAVPHVQSDQARRGAENRRHRRERQRHHGEGGQRQAYRGAALIDADGLWSMIREFVVGDGNRRNPE